MTPVELLADHQAKPRNIGKLMNASAVGDVGSIVVGDALRFYIQVKDEAITAAKFQVFNGTDQVAASSALTELAVGKTLDQAAAIGITDLCAHLGGLDPIHLPPRPWAIDGLRAAVAAYRGEDVDSDEERDPLLCRCHGIPEDTVRQSIQVMDLKETDEVVNATGAGSGCGSCRADIPRLIDAVRNKPKEAPKPAARGTGRIKVIHRITQVVEEQLRPTLVADGGDLELLDLDGNLVVVRGRNLEGDALRTACEVLEKLLRAEVDPALGVSLRP